jgi:electron transport complex protein RnfB
MRIIFQERSLYLFFSVVHYRWLYFSLKEVSMRADPYILLADALDCLPNGFPRTQTGVEIKILHKIFSLEEASLACQLSGVFETVKTIAGRLAVKPGEISHPLIELARRGLIWTAMISGKPHFRLAPFIVGIYEAQVGMIDHELAHLVEDYFHTGGINIMSYQPALHRVVPAQNSVKSEWILPYDDVRSLILSAKVFNVNDCICRQQQKELGHACDYPSRYCLNFSQVDRLARPGDISQQEALEILDRTEEIGLVHTVANVVEGVFYVCNCCGCCCGILRAITEFGLQDSVASANYIAVIDPILCAGCGTCIQRCQVKAISDQDGISVVQRDHCIGCGLCVTGCPNDAARLERKPDSELIHPPLDYDHWEQQRLENRHLP